MPGTRRAPGTKPAPEKSMGELIGDASAELSTLLRQEVALAKAELKEDISTVGKGAGAFGAAAVVGYMAVVFASLTLMFGIAELVDDRLWLGALVVTVLYGGGAAFLVLTGKKTLSGASLGPKRTIQTLKEDAEWAKHPRT